MTEKTKRGWCRFKNATMRGCTIAVAVLLAFFAVMAIVTAANGQSEQGMTFSSMITLTLFSLAIAYAQELFAVGALPTPARWALNFIVVGIAYFFVVLRSGMLIVTSPSFYVIGMLLYAVAYAVIAGISILVHRITKKGAPEAETAEYTSRFS